MSSIDKTHFMIHQEKFTLMPNALINNPEISFKAKGIMAYLLSKPDGWRIVIKELLSHSKESRDAVYSGLKELREAGWIVLEIKRNAIGQISRFIYHVYASPVNNPVVKNNDPQPNEPERENPDMEQPDEESTEEYYNDMSNTDFNNTEESKREETRERATDSGESEMIVGDEDVENDKFEYVEGVFLSCREIENLERKYGEKAFERMLMRFRDYKREKKREYASDYQALLRWFEREKH